MLNTVRTPSARRTGITFAIAGWNAGANMNPIPASSMHRATCAASRSSGMPSASSTSAEPALDDSARFPCFATGSPAPATMNAAAVEMFAVLVPSPPVPHVSTRPVAFGVHGHGVRRASSRASPAISCGGLALHPQCDEERGDQRRGRRRRSTISSSAAARLVGRQIGPRRGACRALREAHRERLPSVRADDRERRAVPARADVGRTHDRRSCPSGCGSSTVRSPVHTHAAFMPAFGERPVVGPVGRRRARGTGDPTFLRVREATLRPLPRAGRQPSALDRVAVSDHVDVHERDEVLLRPVGDILRHVVARSRCGADPFGIGCRSSAPNAMNITGSDAGIGVDRARDLQRDRDTCRVVVRARAPERVVVSTDDHVRLRLVEVRAASRRRSSTRHPAAAGTGGARRPSRAR